MQIPPSPPTPPLGPPNNPRSFVTLPDPIPGVALQCGDCQSPLELIVGTWGLYWACTSRHTTGCKGHVGAHQDSGQPLGIPANAETRAARQRVHAAFDPLWKYGEDGRKTRRRRAYAWLALALGTEGEAHITHLDLAACNRVLDLLKDLPREALESPEVIARADADARAR